MNGTYVRTAPGQRCCSCGCCLFWYVLLSGVQKTPQTPPTPEKVTYRWLQLSLCVSFLIQGFINTLTLSGYLPDILWGFEEGWCAPLSSDCLGHLLMPITGSLPGRCPSAGPSGCPVPLPGAGSRTGGRAGLALAPLRGSAAGLSCAGCGFRHRDEGSSLKNLKEAKKLCWLWYRCKLGNSFHTNGL